jgi:hypothetical protein
MMPRAPLMRAIGKSLGELGAAIEALADDMATLEQETGQQPYTIDEFCNRFRLSTAMYYKLKSQGEGPEEMKLGAKVLITREAASVWWANRKKLLDNA